MAQNKAHGNTLKFAVRDSKEPALQEVIQRIMSQGFTVGINDNNEITFFHSFGEDIPFEKANLVKVLMEKFAAGLPYSSSTQSSESEEQVEEKPQQNLTSSSVVEDNEESEEDNEDEDNEEEEE